MLTFPINENREKVAQQYGARYYTFGFDDDYIDGGPG